MYAAEQTRTWSRLQFPLQYTPSLHYTIHVGTSFSVIVHTQDIQSSSMKMLSQGTTHACVPQLMDIHACGVYLCMFVYAVHASYVNEHGFTCCFLSLCVLRYCACADNNLFDGPIRARHWIVLYVGDRKFKKCSH